jgi:hypothetical protein
VHLDRARLVGAGRHVGGLHGVGLIATGLTVGLDVVARAEALITSSDRALASASASARRAAEALDGVGVGVGQAEASSARAAGLADNASATLEALADSMGVSVFGTQPFLGLASNFRASAEDAAGLADELEALAGSLTATGADTGSLADELVELAEALEPPAPDADPPPMRLGLLIVLAWVALPTLGALGAGAILSGGGRIG